MDEMKINSTFMKGLIATVISKTIHKKLGIEPKISFNTPITMIVDDDLAEAHIDIRIQFPKEDLAKLLKNLV